MSRTVRREQTRHRSRQEGAERHWRLSHTCTPDFEAHQTEKTVLRYDFEHHCIVWKVVTHHQCRCGEDVVLEHYVKEYK